MIQLIEERADAGVEIKVIRAMSRPALGAEVHEMRIIRLPAQAVIRDGSEVFFGSQSLRKVELDQRREVGLITGDPEAVRSFMVIFDFFFSSRRRHTSCLSDWSSDVCSSD